MPLTLEQNALAHLSRRKDIFPVQEKGCMAQRTVLCLAAKRQVPISKEGCEWYGRPGRQSPRGGKLNIIYKKCDFFLRLTLKTMRQKTRGKSTNNFTSQSS